MLFMMGLLGEAIVTTESSHSKGQGSHRLKVRLVSECLKLYNNVSEILLVSGGDKQGVSCQMQAFVVAILDSIPHFFHIVTAS